MTRLILLDTSFFITLLSRNRTNHHTAERYLRYFLEAKDRLYLSTIVISEFCASDEWDKLPHQFLFPLPFTVQHALKSSEFESLRVRGDGASRQSVKDDIKIIAQAHIERCHFILTDDGNTLCRFVDNLRAAQKTSLRALNLGAGFDESLINGTGQTSMPF